MGSGLESLIFEGGPAAWIAVDMRVRTLESCGVFSNLDGVNRLFIVEKGLFSRGLNEGHKVDEIRRLIVLATKADGGVEVRTAAFAELVRRFQDMAYGYAYSILSDFHLAEDAAQEAFVMAFGQLDSLRDPEAFAGWLRRIVRTACSRMTRRKSLPTTDLNAAEGLRSSAAGPQEAAAVNELHDEVLRAVGQLPPPEREVTTLFYINGYSHKDIADFLEVPVTTVKSRLHDSRRRLKERMMNMVHDALKAYALPEDFHVVLDALGNIQSASPALAWFEGRWVLVWQDGQPGKPYNGPFWFLLSESTDARNWSEPRRLAIDPQWPHAPQLCVLKDTLILHTHHHHRGVKVFRSSDLADWTSCPAIQLGDIGRSGVFSSGPALFIAYPIWRVDHGLGDSVELIRSTDGRSWSWLNSPYPSRGTGISDAAGLAVGDSLYVAWREHGYQGDGNTLDVRICRSDDGGSRWSEPVTVAGLSTSQGSLSLVLASGLNDRLVIAQDMRNKDGFTGEILLVTSHDQGCTWPQVARYSAGSLIDPAIAFAPDGTLLLAGSTRDKRGIRPWIVHSHVAIE